MSDSLSDNELIRVRMQFAPGMLLWNVHGADLAASGEDKGSYLSSLPDEAVQAGFRYLGAEALAPGNPLPARVLLNRVARVLRGADDVAGLPEEWAQVLEGYANVGTFPSTVLPPLPPYAGPNTNEARSRWTADRLVVSELRELLRRLRLRQGLKWLRIKDQMVYIYRVK